MANTIVLSENPATAPLVEGLTIGALVSAVPILLFVAAFVACDGPIVLTLLCICAAAIALLLLAPAAICLSRALARHGTRMPRSSLSAKIAGFALVTAIVYGAPFFLMCGLLIFSTATVSR